MGRDFDFEWDSESVRGGYLEYNGIGDRSGLVGCWILAQTWGPGKLTETEEDFEPSNKNTL